MSILGGCSEVAENGNIENSNISKDVEQKLKNSGSENGALEEFPFQF